MQLHQVQTIRAGRYLGAYPATRVPSPRDINQVRLFSCRPTNLAAMTTTTASLLLLPLIFSMTNGQSADPGFPMYGNFAIMPDSFPGIVGVNTDIDVLLLNYGASATTGAEVELSFNDWGVTYQGWQPIGTMSYDVLANNNLQQTFSHVFQSRAHTCLQAVITNPGSV